MISAESENLTRDYKIIRNELKKYSGDLIKKPEYLFLSKSDVLQEKEIKKKLTILKKLNKNVIAISVYDWDSLEKAKSILNKIKSEKISG